MGSLTHRTATKPYWHASSGRHFEQPATTRYRQIPNLFNWKRVLIPRSTLDLYSPNAKLALLFLRAKASSAA